MCGWSRKKGKKKKIKKKERRKLVSMNADGKRDLFILMPQSLGIIIFGSGAVAKN